MMLLHSAALVLAAKDVPSSASADAISTDIAMSEWGGFKALQLDPRTGAYTITPVPETNPLTKRPAGAPRSGVLPPAERARLAPFIRAAIAEGLSDPACERNPRLNGLVVSNGGTPVMRIEVGGRVLRSARSYQCWCPAALKLDRALNDAFRPLTDAMNKQAAARAQGSSASPAPTCGVAHLVSCGNTNALLQDGDFDRAFTRFFGAFGANKVSLIYRDGVLIDQAFAVLGGPPDPPQRLPSGGYLFTACRPHSCTEKGAVGFDSAGRMVAVGMVTYHCDQTCDRSPTLDQFVRRDFPEWDEARRAIRRWADAAILQFASPTDPKQLRAAVVHVLDTPTDNASAGQSLPVTLDQLRGSPDTFAGKQVRVSGQLDDCWLTGNCNLCPVEATP